MPTRSFRSAFVLDKRSGCTTKFLAHSCTKQPQIADEAVAFGTVMCDLPISCEQPARRSGRPSRMTPVPTYPTFGPAPCVAAQAAKVVMLGRDVVECLPRARRFALGEAAEK
jgi:hypothetical protein